MTQLAIYEKRNNEQLQVLAVAKETGKLNSTDLQIAESSSKPKIVTLSQDVLVKKLAIMTKFICRDLGIKTWNDESFLKYDASRFLDILVKHYKTLSLEDVKTAFELLSLGELDEFLPQQNGKPNKEHYQGFNVDFFTRVLNAYQMKKGQVWGKVRKSLPQIEHKATPEEIQGYRNETYKMLYKAFEDFRDNGTGPDFVLTYIGKVFEEAGLFSMREPTKEDLKKALKIAQKNTRTPGEAYELKRMGVNSISVIMQAQRVAMNRNIKEVFEDLIRENTHLNQVLK